MENHSIECNYNMFSLLLANFQDVNFGFFVAHNFLEKKERMIMESNTQGESVIQKTNCDTT